MAIQDATLLATRRQHFPRFGVLPSLTIAKVSRVLADNTRLRLRLRCLLSKKQPQAFESSANQIFHPGMYVSFAAESTFRGQLFASRSKLPIVETAIFHATEAR